MSAVRDLTVALIKGGMDPVEATVLIARAGVEMAPPIDPRSAGARRQAAWRERNKTSQSVTNETPSETSQSVSKHNKTSQSNAASLSIEKDSQDHKKKRESAKASQLPSDWRPDPESWAEAQGILGNLDRAEYELKKFKDHALEKGRVAKNWNAAWRNWAKRAVEYGGRNGNGTSPHRTAGATGPPQTGADAILAGMGRLAARVAERQLAERQADFDLASSDGADGSGTRNGAAAYRRPE